MEISKFRFLEGSDYEKVKLSTANCEIRVSSLGCFQWSAGGGKQICKGGCFTLES